MQPVYANADLNPEGVNEIMNKLVALTIEPSYAQEYARKLVELHYNNVVALREVSEQSLNTAGIIGRHANVILKWTRTKWFGKLKDRKGEYVGEFDESGKRCGKGINIEPDGYKYDGNWMDDTKSGVGVSFYFNRKKAYEGEWRADKMHGKGVWYYENGVKGYDGEWKDNFSDGHGISFYDNSKKCFEGEWKHDQFHGKGIWYDRNGYKRYEGEYSEGLKNGTGIEFFENGSVKHQGTWVKDKFQG